MADEGAARGPRYGLLAPLYDVLAAERVYRCGRVVAVERLRLRRGDHVLDVGCGTGLNFPFLLHEIGPEGRIVGLDASGQMLAQARKRAQSRGWGNVQLLQVDAATFDVERVVRSLGGRAADGALATYALSVMSDWPQAWTRTSQATRVGGRVAIADMAAPSGPWRVLSPLARLAAAAGGAHPWRALEDECDDVEAVSLRGGHVQVRAGTRRAGTNRGTAALDALQQRLPRRM